MFGYSHVRMKNVELIGEREICSIDLCYLDGLGQ